MRIVRVKFLEHYASINDLEGMDKFYLTTMGWVAKEDDTYLRLSMVMDNDGDLTAPYMSIIRKDIIKIEEIHEPILPIQRKSRTRPLKRNGNRSNKD